MIPASMAWLWAQVSCCWWSPSTQALFLVALALLLDYVKRRNRWSHRPPGPTPLPFIGNLALFDRKKPHEFATCMEKKFGSICLFQAGWTDIILLSGFKTIKEALGQKAESFVDRPPVPMLRVAGRAPHCGGIFMASCRDGWREQRRFCLKTLKNSGMGKKTLVVQLSEEARYLCSELKSKEGSLFDPRSSIFRAVGNIICALTFGERFKYTDKTFLKLMHLFEKVMGGLTEIMPQLLAAGSWLSYLPGPHREVQKHFEDLRAMIREIIHEHKKTRDPACPRDLIDAYLEEIEKAEGNPESTFSEQNLTLIVIDLFGAGTETTSSTILWGMIYMVFHPEVQKRIQEEIDTVIGKLRSPVMEDQLIMPYVTAVIHEIQRLADIVPLAFPYITYKDTEVGEFVIPKETVVFSHVSSVLKDETMWEKPHEFYPEHFLDAEGRFVKREAFLPFSLGRHVCPGEQLAKMELFLFLTSLLQHFTFCLPENCPRPSVERVFALTISPSPFQICAIPR